MNTIRVSNILDQDLAHHLARPDLGPNCLQRLSEDDTSRKRLITSCITGVKYVQDQLTKQCKFLSLANDTHDVGVTAYQSYSVFMKDPMQFFQLNSSYKYAGQVSWYGKCSKMSNTFLFLFSNIMLVTRAGIHKMLVQITNRKDPDQTASSEAV